MAGAPQHFEDDEIIRYAERNEGIKFKQLMAGNTGKDQSKLDNRIETELDARAELLTILAYYCDGPIQIDRIFHKSKLYKNVKEEWDTVSESEIQNAKNACEGHYYQESPPVCPIIQVNDRNLPEVSDDTIDALTMLNKTKPIIFQRSGELCRIIRDDDNIPSIELYDQFSVVYVGC